MLHQFVKERSHSNVTFVATAVLKELYIKTHVALIHEGKKLFQCEIPMPVYSLRRYMNKHVASVVFKAGI